MTKKTYKVNQISYLSEFKCLLDKCPDDCCSRWVIDVTPENKKLYDEEKPEIAAHVEERENGSGYRMEKNHEKDCCHWFQDGLCTIHANYGEKFLPDICNFFPQNYRKFNDDLYLVANLSCPESLRIALYSDQKDSFSSFKEIEQNRIKSNIHDSKSYEFEELENKDLVEVYKGVIDDLTNDNLKAEESLARLLLIGTQFDQYKKSSWPNVKEQIFSDVTQDKILRIANYKDNKKFFKIWLTSLLEAMFVLVNRDRPRYNELIEIIDEVLGNHESDPNQLFDNYQKIKEKWLENDAEFDPLLKNLIKAQISYAMFPIACYFNKKADSALLFAFEYMAIKLALMCYNYKLDGNMKVQDVIDAIQPVARRFYVRKKQELFDFCEESGWKSPNKIISLILSL